MCAFDAVPSSLWRSLRLRLLCVSSGDVPCLWIFGSSAIGDVTIFMAHVQHVTVVSSWNETVHWIFYLFMEACTIPSIGPFRVL